MKIICIGRNYAKHIEELKNERPSEPVIFMKPDSAVLLKQHPFVIPEFSDDIHHEIELIVKINKVGKYIDTKFAHKYYDEISVGIDFTARDLQNELKAKGLPWEKAKAWDNSAIIGKWVDTTPALLKEPINVSLKNNEVIVQEGLSDDMMFSFDQIIAHISNYFSLNIGDLVFTGTPAGVGECVVGDILEGFLEKEKMFELEIK